MTLKIHFFADYGQSPLARSIKAEYLFIPPFPSHKTRVSVNNMPRAIEMTGLFLCAPIVEPIAC